MCIVTPFIYHDIYITLYLHIAQLLNLLGFILILYRDIFIFVLLVCLKLETFLFTHYNTWHE